MNMLQAEGNILMKKNEIIRILQKNKAAHLRDYAKAVKGYKKKAKKLLTQKQAELKAGKLNGVYLNLAVPINRQKEIDTTIEMFHHDTRFQIELTMSQYNEYILDRGNAAITAFSNNSVYYNS